MQSLSLTEEELTSLVDNTLKKYQITQQSSYYLLIKTAQHKPKPTLYLTDGAVNFWVVIVDLEYFLKLRNYLHLSSELRSFVIHLISSILNSSKVIKDQSNKSIRIEICLGIGQGLVMNCPINFRENINANSDLIKFQKQMKMYSQLCWSAFQSKIKEQQDHADQKVQDLISKNKFDKDRSGSSNAKNQRNFPRKNRNIINPNKPKRKTNGAKLGIKEDHI